MWSYKREWFYNRKSYKRGLPEEDLQDFFYPDSKIRQTGGTDTNEDISKRIRKA